MFEEEEEMRFEKAFFGRLRKEERGREKDTSLLEMGGRKKTMKQRTFILIS